jgi:hypothetical protein
MLVNQIAHDSRLRTAKRLRPLLQEGDVPPVHFQRDCFHGRKVLSLWQQVNTGIIVVLDNRIPAKQYGQAFLDALPKCPVEVV